MGELWRAILGIQSPRITSRLRKKEELAVAFERIFPSNLISEEVLFFCIGTNQINGDSLGPEVGSLLGKMGYVNVIGTRDHPVHALNIEHILKELPTGKIVIAVDAALGTYSHLHSFSVVKGPIQPGLGVGRTLPAVGDYGIMGITDLKSNPNRLILPDRSASCIKEMVSVLVAAIIQRFPLEPFR